MFCSICGDLMILAVSTTCCASNACQFCAEGAGAPCWNTKCRRRETEIEINDSVRRKIKKFLNDPHFDIDDETLLTWAEDTESKVNFGQTFEFPGEPANLAEAARCLLCKSVDHQTKFCPTLSAAVCKKCGKKGHLALKCPRKRKAKLSKSPQSTKPMNIDGLQSSHCARLKKIGQEAALPAGSRKKNDKTDVTKSEYSIETDVPKIKTEKENRVHNSRLAKIEQTSSSLTKNQISSSSSSSSPSSHSADSSRTTTSTNSASGKTSSTFTPCAALPHQSRNDQANCLNVQTGDALKGIQPSEHVLNPSAKQSKEDAKSLNRKRRLKDFFSPYESQENTMAEKRPKLNILKSKEAFKQQREVVVVRQKILTKPSSDVDIMLLHKTEGETQPRETTSKESEVLITSNTDILEEKQTANKTFLAKHSKAPNIQVNFLYEETLKGSEIEIVDPKVDGVQTGNEGIDEKGDTKYASGEKLTSGCKTRGADETGLATNSASVKNKNKTANANEAERVSLAVEELEQRSHQVAIDDVSKTQLTRSANQEEISNKIETNKSNIQTAPLNGEGHSTPIITLIDKDQSNRCTSTTNQGSDILEIEATKNDKKKPCVCSCPENDNLYCNKCPSFEIYVQVCDIPKQAEAKKIYNMPVKIDLSHYSTMPREMIMQTFDDTSTKGLLVVPHFTFIRCAEEDGNCLHLKLPVILHKAILTFTLKNKPRQLCVGKFQLFKKREDFSEDVTLHRRGLPLTLTPGNLSSGVSAMLLLEPTTKFREGDLVYFLPRDPSTMVRRSFTGSNQIRRNNKKLFICLSLTNPVNSGETIVLNKGDVVGKIMPASKTECLMSTEAKDWKQHAEEDKSDKGTSSKELHEKANDAVYKAIADNFAKQFSSKEASYASENTVAEGGAHSSTNDATETSSDSSSVVELSESETDTIQREANIVKRSLHLRLKNGLVYDPTATLLRKSSKDVQIEAVDKEGNVASFAEEVVVRLSVNPKFNLPLKVYEGYTLLGVDGSATINLSFDEYLKQKVFFKKHLIVASCQIVPSDEIVKVAGLFDEIVKEVQPGWKKTVRITVDDAFIGGLKDHCRFQAVMLDLRESAPMLIQDTTLEVKEEDRGKMFVEATLTNPAESGESVDLVPGQIGTFIFVVSVRKSQCAVS